MTSLRPSARVESRASRFPLEQTDSPRSANDSPRRASTRSATAPRMTDARRERIAASLSDRDRQVVASVRELRLATGEQLARLHFADVSARERRRVLTRLVELRVLARLPRPVGGVRAGSVGFVYAVDVVGQRLTDGTGPAHGYRIRRPWQPGLWTTAHTLGVSELRVRLTEAERRGELRVVSFQAEPVCWRRYVGPGGGLVTLKPDAAVELAVNGYRDSWFVEIDRGTEAPRTLAKKAEAYIAYWRSGQEAARHGVHPRAVFVVLDDARHDVVVDLLGRQPTEAWSLFAVTTFEAVIDRLEEGAHV